MPTVDTLGMERDSSHGTTGWTTEAVGRTAFLMMRSISRAAQQTKPWMATWLVGVLVATMTSELLHGPLVAYLLLSFILVLATATATAPSPAEFDSGYEPDGEVLLEPVLLELGVDEPVLPMPGTD